jgi:hypothetical protein
MNYAVNTAWQRVKARSDRAVVSGRSAPARNSRAFRLASQAYLSIPGNQNMFDLFSGISLSVGRHIRAVYCRRYGRNKGVAEGAKQRFLFINPDGAMFGNPGTLRAANSCQERPLLRFFSVLHKHAFFK